MACLPLIFLLHVLSLFLCMIHVHHMKDTGFHIICICSCGFLSHLRITLMGVPLCNNNLAQTILKFKLECCIK